MAAPSFSRGLAEIVLIVRDVFASAEFYRDVIGLTPETGPTETWAWSSAGFRDAGVRPDPVRLDESDFVLLLRS